MDGRKNNSGKKGNKGGGRKPLALELSVRDMVLEHVPKAIDTLVDVMTNGDKGSDRVAASRLILAYYFGQPKQQIDLESRSDVNVTNAIDYTKLTDDDIRNLAEIQRKAGTY